MPLSDPQVTKPWWISGFELELNQSKPFPSLPCIVMLSSNNHEAEASKTTSLTATFPHFLASHLFYLTSLTCILASTEAEGGQIVPRPLWWSLGYTWMLNAQNKDFSRVQRWCQLGGKKLDIGCHCGCTLITSILILDFHLFGITHVPWQQIFNWPLALRSFTRSCEVRLINKKTVLIFGDVFG